MINLIEENLDTGYRIIDNTINLYNRNSEREIMNEDVFYEVKYTNKPLDLVIIYNKIEQVNMTNLKPIKYGFISKNGLKPYEFLIHRAYFLIFLIFFIFVVDIFLIMIYYKVVIPSKHIGIVEKRWLNMSNDICSRCFGC